MTVQVSGMNESTPLFQGSSSNRENLEKLATTPDVLLIALTPQIFLYLHFEPLCFLASNHWSLYAASTRGVVTPSSTSTRFKRSSVVQGNLTRRFPRPRQRPENDVRAAAPRGKLRHIISPFFFSLAPHRTFKLPYNTSIRKHLFVSRMAVKQLTLNSGASIPQIGFGTWQSATKEVETAVYEALKAGYTHLDLAKIYQNQEEVAAGIKKSGVSRDGLFITSKLWCNSHRPENVEPALDQTLKELNLEYLDLYLIHWPIAFLPEGDQSKNLFPKGEALNGEDQVALDLDVSLLDTWKAMIKLLDTGKVKSIGVSNFSTTAIDTLIKETGVTPAVNQIERHPLLIQPELVKHHAEKGIHITAYSPLGNNNVGAKKLFEYEEVIEIAKKYNATPAQVLIAWGARGGHSVIPKSVTPSRIASNFVQIELKDEDYEELSKLGQGSKKHRFNIPYNYRPQWNIGIFDEESEKTATHKPKVV